MKQPNVTDLGIGYHQLKAIKTLSKNYNIYGFDFNDNPIAKKKVTRFFNIDLNNKEKILEICKKNKIIKAFSFNSESPLKTVFFINNIICNENKKLNLIQNKYLLRKKLKKNNLPTPNFLILKNQKHLNKIQYPLVAKPIFGAGSRGVFIAKNKENFKKLYIKNKNFYKEKKLLIERYIPGTEYAADGWIEKNQKIIVGAISKKKRSKGPELFDESLIINFQNFYLYNNLKKFLKKLFQLLKLKNTVFHIEYKFYKKKIYLIDFSIRGAGFSVYSEILRKIINQNTDQILIDMFFNKDVKINNSSKEIFFLFFLNYKKKKLLNDDKIYKKVSNLKTLSKIEFYKGITKLEKNSNLRYGHILLSSYTKNILNEEIKLLRKILD